MPVESGLHRVLGFYTALPRLLRRAGTSMDDIVCWENELEIRTPSGARAVLGASPLHKPLATHLCSPTTLDRRSVTQLAQRWRVTKRAQEQLLITLTAGLFFLPPERFSAANFIGLLAAALSPSPKTRLGAYLEGMTDVMCQPITDAATARGATIRVQAPVENLRIEDAAVRGVRLRGGGEIAAQHVVLATALGAAQRLLRPG